MTERDQFIQSQVQGLLAPGETIRNMAYVLRAPGIMMQIIYTMICFWIVVFQTKHYYAALTDRRLILVKTKGGFFRPKITNEGIEEIPLANVKQVSFGGFANNRSITFHKHDGSEETIRIGPMGRLCAGQKTFMDDVKGTHQALAAQAGGAVA